MRVIPEKFPPHLGQVSLVRIAPFIQRALSINSLLFVNKKVSLCQVLFQCPGVGNLAPPDMEIIPAVAFRLVHGVYFYIMHGKKEIFQSLLAADEDAAKMWVDQGFSTPFAIFAMAGNRILRRVARSGMA